MKHNLQQLREWLEYKGDKPLTITIYKSVNYINSSFFSGGISSSGY